jgi:hypothetical protein
MGAVDDVVLPAAQHITIPARFCGPPNSGNGGYSSGLLAEQLTGPCQVTLRSPPPLDTPLFLGKNAAGQVALHHGDVLVAEAVPAAVELELPEPPSFEQAEVAARSFIGLQSHPYPTCFVCGPTRPNADGLALFPGAVEGRPLVAAPWCPPSDLCNAHGQVETRFVWSALDCPSWFGFLAFSGRTVPTLLGRLTAEVHRAPLRDERCVVLGWHERTEGRRILCASAIFAADGSCLARSRSTWVMLKT